MHRTFDILGLCLLAMMGLSCSSNQNIKESYSIESFTDKPRVFYGVTGNPSESNSRSENCERLSTEELGRIQTSISELTHEPIWFVRVPLMSSPRSRSQLWVYLAPDIANTRFRSGWAYTLRTLHRSKGPFVSPPWRYVQVSLPNKVFDPNLETPEVHDLPFPYPPRDRTHSENKHNLLSQEDIIKVMDYVRKPDVYHEFEDRKILSKESLPGGGTKYRAKFFIPRREKIAELVISKPVVSIRKSGDEITVTFGFVHNGLFARCYSLRLRVTEHGYEIVNWNVWVS